MSPKKEANPYVSEALPFISKEIMDWLEKTVPERCPNIMDTERQIWMYAGKRELVLALKRAYDRQNANGTIQIH